MQKALGWDSGDTSLESAPGQINKQSDININVIITNQLKSLPFCLTSCDL